MATKSMLLTLQDGVYRDLINKAKKLHYENAQQYVYDIIRRNVYSRKTSKKKTSDQELMDKFSSPTRQSKKIEQWASKYGI